MTRIRYTNLSTKYEEAWASYQQHWAHIDSALLRVFSVNSHRHVARLSYESCVRRRRLPLTAHPNARAGIRPERCYGFAISSDEGQPTDSTTCEPIVSITGTSHGHHFRTR